MTDRSDPDPIEAAAADWAARSLDPGFEDWADLAAWLDGDPHRNHRYDAAICAIEDGLASLPVVARNEDSAVPPPARRDPLPRPRQRRERAGGRRHAGRRVAVAGALAAAMAGVFLLAQPDAVPSPSPAPMLVDVPPGGARRITLADGSAIEAAGGTRLRIDRAGARDVTMERGRALFTVAHDERRPFSVRVGGHRFLDAGTVFEVVRERDGVRVSVAEGAVIVNPDARAVTLRPGERATLRDGSADPVLGRVAPEAIGGWRGARLSYRDAPLAQVADDLSGALGHEVRASPALADRRFTGTLVPASLRRQPAALDALLDVAVHVDADRWELRPR